MGNVTTASLESKANKKVNKTKSFNTKFALIWKWTYSAKKRNSLRQLEMLMVRKKIRRKTNPSRTSKTEGCRILLSDVTRDICSPPGEDVAIRTHGHEQ